MLKIGKYNELVVEREVDFGFYLNPKEDEVLLPRKYAPPGMQPGDTLKVFVYTDSEDRPVATTLQPKAVVGEFAFLKVTDVSEFGAFLDWGLEKDLLVPYSEQKVRMDLGKKYVVKVFLDEKTGRVFAGGRIARYCEPVPKQWQVGQAVDLLIYETTPIGIMAVVDGRCSGMLHKGDNFEPLAIGDQRHGYISKVRPDGRIDLMLRQPGYHSITASSRTVLDVLARGGGFMPCHDKSPPELIRRHFSMSKKEFKRAVGNLYKAGKIDLTDKGIRIKS